MKRMEPCTVPADAQDAGEDAEDAAVDSAVAPQRSSRILPGAAFRTPRTAARALRLLVVEDEVLVAQTIRETVEDLGHVVCGIADTETGAIDLAGRERPDLALMDVRLSAGDDGINAARSLATAFGIRSIFLSGYADRATMGRITEAYPLGVVHKPFSAAQLKNVLDLAARRLRVTSR